MCLEGRIISPFVNTIQSCTWRHFRALSARVSRSHLLSKEKLPIQIREIDRVKVYNVDILEAGKGEVLQYFAPEPPRADAENRRLAD